MTLETRIPPPVVFALAAGLMWLLARLLPPLSVSIPARGWWAGACGVAGVVVALLAVVEFRRAGTTVDPTRPGSSSAVVDTGIYRWTRNPMYLGLLLVLLGWTVFLSSLAPLLGLALFVLYVTRFQIQPEERALEQKFGAQYAAYKQRVRRWL